MHYSTLLLLASSLLRPVLAQDDESYHGEEASKHMAGVAFMWPPDRAWSESDDNTAPCGSSQGVVNRTDFPLINGAIALVTQDDSWSVKVAISYNSDPTSNNDFETLIPSRRITEIDEGHMCYPIPDPDADAVANNNGNATLQIQYTSDLFDDRNETYYACADIHFVSLTEFETQIPCFNVTSDNFTAPPEDTDSDSDSDSDASTSEGDASDEDNEEGLAALTRPSVWGTFAVAAMVVLAFGSGLL